MRVELALIVFVPQMVGTHTQIAEDPVLRQNPAANCGTRMYAFSQDQAQQRSAEQIIETEAQNIQYGDVVLLMNPNHMVEVFEREV